MSVGNTDEALNNQRAVDAVLVNVRDARRRLEQIIPLLDPDMKQLLQSSLANVIGLEDQLAAGGVKPADLPNMAQIAATIQAMATGLETSLAGNTSKDGMEQLIESCREESRAMMRDLSQFDRLLKFENAEEEAAYRQREEARRKQFEAENAKGTPEGDLNAAGIALGQATDLAVHGGMDSPAIGRRLGHLAEAATALRDQMIREGRDVSDFDKGLQDDLRAIMRSKGIAEDKIDALLDAHRDNPVDAVKAFVTDYHASVTAKDLDRIEGKMQQHQPEQLEENTPQSAPTPSSSSPLAASLKDASAELIALGIGLTEHDAATPPSHGVHANALSGTQQTVLS